MMLLYLLIPLLLVDCEGLQFIVIPSIADCPSDIECYTLDYFHNNSKLQNQESVDLMLFDGIYNLPKPLMFNTVRSLSLARLSTDGMVLFNRVNLTLFNVSNFEIDDIHLVHCFIRAEHFNENGYRFQISNAVLKGTKSFSTIKPSKSPSLVVELYNTTMSDGSIFVFEIPPSVAQPSVVVSLTKCSFPNSEIAFYLHSRTVFQHTDINMRDINVTNSSLGIYLDTLVENFFMRVENVRIQKTFIPLEVNLRSNSENVYKNSTVVFTNLAIIENIQHGTSSQPTAVGAVFLNNINNAIFNDCHFDGNSGLSTLIAFDSLLYFKGNTTFSNNKGSNGGAICIAFSTMYFHKESTVSFVNNTAEVIGGAIFVSTNSENDLYGIAPDIEESCPYQLAFDIPEPLLEQNIPVSLIFQNNTAPSGGKDIFGAALQSSCLITPNKKVFSFQIYQKIFTFESNYTVSSTARRVCQCTEGIPDCLQSEKEINVTAGEKFSLSLALVGNDFGLTIGQVYGLDLKHGHRAFKFGDGQDLQIIRHPECVSLQYEIHPSRESITQISFLLAPDTITATSQKAQFNQPQFRERHKQAVKTYLATNNKSIGTPLLTHPLHIVVNIKPCPLGLMFNSASLTCECHPYIQQFTDHCEVNDGQVQFERIGFNWTYINEENNELLLSDGCLNCDREVHIINVYNSDSQCINARGGKLCGGCQANLSLGLGSRSCVSGERNNGLALIVAFIVLGLVLVLLIKILDITTSHGAINGLIFYANMIWIFHDFVFRNTSTEDTTYSKLALYFRLVLSWLNLDFGISVYFFDQYNDYISYWLQFVFPAYVVLLGIVCALLSKFKPAIFGQNGFAVLATVMLMSFQKIWLTNCMILMPSHITSFSQDGSVISRSPVWIVDGSLNFQDKKYIWLVIAAIASMLIFVLPSIMILLFIHPIKKIKLKAIKYILYQFKPLIKAFTQPLNKKCQFWIGLRLLIRYLAVAIFSINIIFIKNIDYSLGVIILMCCFLSILAPYVYRNTWIAALNIAFTYNLNFMLGLLLAFKEVHHRVVISSAFVTAALLMFIGILVYHVCLKLQLHIKCKSSHKLKDEEFLSSSFSETENVSMHEYPTSGHREEATRTSFRIILS